MENKKSNPFKALFLIGVPAVILFLLLTLVKLPIPQAHQNTFSIQDTAQNREEITTPEIVKEVGHKTPAVSNRNSSITETQKLNKSGCADYLFKGKEFDTVEHEIECMKEYSGNPEEFRFTYFPEKIILFGEYVRTVSLDEDEFPLYGRGEVCFDVQKDYLNRVPKGLSPVRSVFCFINSDAAAKEFGIENFLFDQDAGGTCDVSGKAEIEVSDFFADNIESEGIMNSAKLTRVIKKESAKMTCL